MNDLRPTTAQFRRALKSVVRRLLEMAGGVSSFEHATRVKAPVLSKYGSVTDEKHMPLDVAMDLMKDTGSNGILSLMAAELGYKLEALDTVPLGAELPGVEEIAKLWRKNSELVDAIVAAVSDGKISASENRNINDKLERLVQFFRALQRQVNNATDGGDE